MPHRTSAPRPTELSGYTLVELLIAAAVFAVGLAALMPLLVANVRSNDLASVRTRAVALAQEKVEELGTLPYDQWASLAAGTETVDGIFTRRWEPVPVPVLPGDGDDLGRILVTVSWNQPSRGSGSVSLVTSRARY